MRILLAKLTSKNQAVIPKAVREFLHLHSKDQIAYEIHSNMVILRKAAPLDVQYLNAVTDTLSEWSSQEDETAYGNL